MKSHLGYLFLSLWFPSVCGEPPSDIQAPAPEPPVYQKVKDLRLQTQLVAGGEAKVTIVTPASGVYDDLAGRIQRAIRDLTGAEVPISTDDSGLPKLPTWTNLIVLGNRSTNSTISRLYDLYYCILDLKYPGPGGYNVRTLHNPFGNGRNVVLIGASDTGGMEAATGAFISILERTGKATQLSVGPLMEIRLGTGVRIDGLKEWDAGRQGAYGWNKVSRHMAMYYMTGQEEHVRHVLRYAFPDDQTREELQKDEFNRYQDSPLAESSDYDSHLMVLFWDLIEESPVWS